MLNGRKISRDVYSRAMSGISVAKKNGGQTSAIFANDTRWRPNSQILHRRDRSNLRVTETARPSGVLLVEWVTHVCLDTTWVGSPLHLRAAVTEERLKCLGYLELWIFENKFRDIFFPKMHGIPERHLGNNAYKCPKLTQDGMSNVSSWYKPRLTFTAVNKTYWDLGKLIFNRWRLVPYFTDTDCNPLFLDQSKYHATHTLSG